MNEIFLDLVTYSFELGQRVLAARSEASRKEAGQFLTPAPIARFMAQQLGPIRPGDRILDPAIGSGVLACAIIERVVAEKYPREFWLDGYEIDSDLEKTAIQALNTAKEYAASHGIMVHIKVYKEDFILHNVPRTQPYLLLAEGAAHLEAYSTYYNQIIANPPYFKLNSDDSRVKTVAGQIQGHTNIYTLFLALAVKKLSEKGQACFIIPRSFCSGAYFSALRQDLIQEALPVSVHLIENDIEYRYAWPLEKHIIFHPAHIINCRQLSLKILVPGLLLERRYYIWETQKTRH